MAIPFRPTPQMVKNGQTFDALPIGAGFELVNENGWTLIEVYFKIGVDRVQASDGRQWNVAQTRIPGAGVIIVPFGSRSTAPYAVSLNPLGRI